MIQDYAHDVRVLTGRFCALDVRSWMRVLVCSGCNLVFTLVTEVIEGDKARLQIKLQVGLAVKALRDTTRRVLNLSSPHFKLLDSESTPKNGRSGSGTQAAVTVPCASDWSCASHGPSLRGNLETRPSPARPCARQNTSHAG